MRISLLRFFKIFHEYVAYAILYSLLLRFLANAILCAIYFITAINLPNAIFT